MRPQSWEGDRPCGTGPGQLEMPGLWLQLGCPGKVVETCWAHPSPVRHHCPVDLKAASISEEKPVTASRKVFFSAAVLIFTRAISAVLNVQTSHLPEQGPELALIYLWSRNEHCACFMPYPSPAWTERSLQRGTGGWREGLVWEIPIRDGKIWTDRSEKNWRSWLCIPTPPHCCLGYCVFCFCFFGGQRWQGWGGRWWWGVVLVFLGFSFGKEIPNPRKSIRAPSWAHSAYTCCAK